MKKKWRVIRTIWPFDDGWGVCDKDKTTLYCDGLSKSEAQAVCDEMNQSQEGGE